MSLERFLKSAKKIQEQHQRTRSPDGPKSTYVHDDSNWLVSYADMMTLLCGFFIMLFSMAHLEAPKYEALKSAMSKQFHGVYVDKPGEMAHFLTQVLQEAGVKKEVVVKPDPAGVQIVFESTLFFDTLSAEVRSEGRTVLDRLIDGLSGYQKRENKLFRIVIEGHTDSRPILGGIFPSNWELSAARAARVVRIFIDRGFEPARMTAIGYADTQPAQAGGRTPAGSWDELVLAKNRRVVVRILEPLVESIPRPDSEAAVAETPPQAPSAAGQP
jgi:chemotaxis protein MotB